MHIPASQLAILGSPASVTFHALPPDKSVPLVGSVEVAEVTEGKPAAVPPVLSEEELAKNATWTLSAVKESLRESEVQMWSNKKCLVVT